MSAKTPGTSWSTSSPAQAATLGEDGEHGLIVRKAGKWGKPDFPRTGWEPHHVEDLGEPDMICEMCEYKEIRYVHHMHHPETGLKLRTGCVCAGHMQGDLSAAHKRDVDMQNATKRVTTRQRSLDMAWQAFECTPQNDVAAFKRIYRDAVRLKAKASSDADRYPSSKSHFVLAIDTGVFTLRVLEALERAKQHAPYRLAKQLADPCWYDTAKGQRFETFRGDVVQVYRRGIGFGYGFQVGRMGEMSWGKRDYDTMDDACTAGLKALRSALRAAGRLPRLH